MKKQKNDSKKKNFKFFFFSNSGKNEFLNLRFFLAQKSEELKDTCELLPTWRSEKKRTSKVGFSRPDVKKILKRKRKTEKERYFDENSPGFFLFKGWIRIKERAPPGRLFFLGSFLAKQSSF